MFGRALMTAANQVAAIDKEIRGALLLKPGRQFGQRRRNVLLDRHRKYERPLRGWGGSSFRSGSVEPLPDLGPRRVDADLGIVTGDDVARPHRPDLAGRIDESSRAGGQPAPPNTTGTRNASWPRFRRATVRAARSPGDASWSSSTASRRTMLAPRATSPTLSRSAERSMVKE